MTLSNMMHVYVASLAWVLWPGCRDVRYRPPGKRPVTEPMGFSDGRRFFPHMDMEHCRSMRARASFGMHVEACSMIDLRSRTAVGCNLNGWPAGGEPTEHTCGELENC